MATSLTRRLSRIWRKRGPIVASATAAALVVSALIVIQLPQSAHASGFVPTATMTSPPASRNCTVNGQVVDTAVDQTTGTTYVVQKGGSQYTAIGTIDANCNIQKMDSSTYSGQYGGGASTGTLTNGASAVAVDSANHRSFLIGPDFNYLAWYNGPQSLYNGTRVPTPAPAPIQAATTAITKHTQVPFTQVITNLGGAVNPSIGCTVANSTSLPSGVTLSVSTSTGTVGWCVLSGTASVAGGNYTFDVSATNGTGVSTTHVTLNMDASPTLSSPVNLYWATGTQNSFTVTPTLGAAPFSYSITSSNPPSWLQIDPATGVLTGTPTSVGASSVTVRITNSAGHLDVPVSVTALDAPVWQSSIALPTSAFGAVSNVAPFSYQLPAPSSGTGPFIYSVTGLPTGLTVNPSTGLISGIPVIDTSMTPTHQYTDSTFKTITYTVMNAAASTAAAAGATVSPSLVQSRTSTTEFKPLTSNIARTVVGTNQGNFVVTVKVGDSLTPINLPGLVALSSCTVTGNLPSWLTQTSSCSGFSGTVPAGATTVRFQLTDQYNYSQAYVVVVQTPPGAPGTGSPPLVQLPAWPSPAVIGVPFSYQVPTPPVGDGPYTFYLNGSLPAGLSLNTVTGLISGIPNVNYQGGLTGTFSVWINNAVGSIATTSMTVQTQTVTPAYTTSSVTVNSAELAPISVPPPAQVANTTPATDFTSTALPAGLTLDPTTGILSGSPTAPGVYTIQVTGSAYQYQVSTPPVVSGTYTVTVNATQSVSATGFSDLAVNSVTHKVYLLNPTLNAVYEFDETTQLWSATPLPAGTTPTSFDVDTANNRVYVTDSANNRVLVIDPTVASVVSTLSVGSTPTSISIDSVHHLAYVANSGGTTISVLNVATGTPTLSSSITTLSNAPQLVSVDTTNQRLYVSSVNGATFAVVDLRDSNKVYEFGGAAIQALAANPVQGIAYYGEPSLGNFTQFPNGTAGTIGFAALISSAAPPTTATVQTPYNFQVTANGTAVSFTVSSGSLPPGLSLSSSGTISGTPTTPGNYSFSVQAANNYGSDSRSYTISFPNPVPVLGAMTLPTGYVGESYNRGNAVTLPSSWLGSSYAYQSTPSFSVTSGALPSWLSLDPNTGVLTGTASPTSTGTYSFTVTGTNTSATSSPVAQTVSQTYSLTVSGIRPPLIDRSYVNSSNFQLVEAAGSTQPIYLWLGGAYDTTNGPAVTTPEWTISAGQIPPGLTFDNSVPGNEKIWGVMTAPAGTPYSYTVRLTDGATGLYDEVVISGTVQARAPQDAYPYVAAFEGVPFSFDPLAPLGGYAGLVGSRPMTFSMLQGSPDQLPSGLSLNTTTGVISGTPAVGTASQTGHYGIAGSFSVEVNAHNSAGDATIHYQFSVSAATLLTETISVAEGGSLHYQSAAPTGAPAASPNNWWREVQGMGSLPSWVSYDGSCNNCNGTGLMTGTAPNTPGTSTFGLQYQDVSNNTQYILVTLNVTPPPPAMASTTAITEPGGVAFSYTIANTGGAVTAGTGCSLANSTTLPTGVTLSDSSGSCVLTGTSSVSLGSSSFDVSATNANGTSATTVTLNIVAIPVVASPITLYWPTGTSTSYTISPSAGATPYTFAASNLPSGWSLGASSGVLTGSPSAAGLTSVSATVANSVTPSSGGPVPVTVNVNALVAPVWPTINLPQPYVGVPYSYTLPTPSGTGPFTYTASNLPAGLSLNTSTGVISGTPTTLTLASSVVFTAVNTAASLAASTGAVVAPSLTAQTSVSASVALQSPIVQAITPTFTYGVPSTYQISTTGSNPAPTGFALYGAPSWLTVSSSGLLSGTAPVGTTGPVNFTVIVSNGAPPATVQASMALSTAAPTAAPSSTSVPPLTTQSYQLTQTGGSPASSFVLGTDPYGSGNTAPNWVSINSSNGLVTFTNPPVWAIGTPVTFPVTLSNSAGSVTTSLTVNVADVPMIPQTLTYTVPTGTSWTHDLSTDITSANGPYTWALAPGSTAPSWASATGLFASSGQTGVITGTPTSPAGTSTFTVIVSNQNGPSQTVVTIVTVDPSVYPSSFSQILQTGVAFSYTPLLSSGSPAASWAVTSGSLPSWLSLNTTTGVISAAPAPSTAVSAVSFTVTGTNVAGSSSIAYTLSVQAPPTAPTLSPPAAVVGVPYSYAVPTPPSGTGPFTYTLNGTLPAGLTLTNGVISGTPTGTGSTGSFTITVNNGLTTQNGTGAVTTAQASITSTLPPAPVMASTTTLTQVVGQAFSSTIANTGGSATASTGCSVVNSTTLPTGVTLSVVSGACVLTGTSSVALGSYSFDVKAQNLGGSSTTVVTLNIVAIPVVTSPVNLYWPTTTSSSYTITPSSGATPFSYAITSSSPPGWASVSSSGGVFTATPTLGLTSLTVGVSNSATTSSGPVPVVLNVTGVVPPVWPSITWPQPSVGVPFSYTLPAPTSGTGPFTYSVTGLPAGLSLNTSTGLITGTPTTAAGSTSMTFTVTNAAAALAATSGAVVSSSLTAQQVIPTTVTTLAPVYPSAVTRYVQTSGSLSLTPSLTSGSPATSWTVSTGSLPSWVSLNSTTGVLSGTAPSTAETDSFTVTGSNGTTPDAQVAYTIKVQDPPVLGSVSPPAPTIGVPYSYTIPVTGTGPFTYTLSGSTPLPAGLTFVNGVISGTPTGTGSTGSFTVTVNNGLTTQNNSGAATSGSVSLTSVIVPPVFTPASTTLSSANLASLNYTPTQTSTSTPATYWTATGLPSGVSVNAQTGAITGTPSTPGVYTIVVTGAVGSGVGAPSGQQTITLTVTGPPIVQAATTTFTYGVAGSYQIVTTGSTPAATSFTPSGAPGWVTVSSSGVITGTAPVGTVSPVTFTVAVGNGVGVPTVLNVSIALVTAPPTIGATVTSTPVGPLSTSTFQLTQSGGSPASAFVFGTTTGGVGNTAPSWVSINTTTGLLSYTNPPNSAIGQTFTFPVTLSNTAGSVTTNVSVTVANVPIIPATLTFAVPTGGTWTHDLANDITSNNGPFTWALPVTVPSWVNAAGLFAATNQTGVISGTPTTPGTDTFTVDVSNTNGTSQTVVTIVRVDPPVMTGGTLTAATTGVSYTASAAASSGTGPLTYSATGLPAGVTINPSTGALSGTPTTSGSYSNIQITATNTNYPGITTTGTYSLTVTTLAPVLPSTLPLSGVTTAAMSSQIVPTGGSPAVSWQLTGTAPGGVSLNPSTGVLSGTPVTAGVFTFTVTATNTAGTSNTLAVTFTVTAPPLFTSNPIVLVAPTGSAYSYTFAPTGGGPYTYTVASGALPGWASLVNGQITGTPTTAGGPSSVVVNVTNAAGTTPVTVQLSSAIPAGLPATLTITDTVGTPSTHTLTPTGTGPFSWSTSSPLPAGVTVTNGVISGNPTGTVASTSFTVSATGAAGPAATTTVSYSAAYATPVVPGTATVYATVGHSLSHSFASTGGSPVVSWVFSTASPALPGALALNSATGLWSGTPASGDAGTYTATLTASNGGGGSATTAVTLIVLTQPSVTTTTAPNMIVGTGYTFQATGTGTGTLTYAISPALPTGVSINPSTGAITGTPQGTTGGTTTYTITVTNQAGVSVSGQVPITLVVPASIPATTTVPAGQLGTGYTATLTPSGTGPFAFSVQGGTLPAGLSLNPTTGQITGTPTAAGTSTVTIAVTGAAGNTVTTSVSITIAPAAAVSGTSTGGGAGTAARAGRTTPSTGSTGSSVPQSTGPTSGTATPTRTLPQLSGTLGSQLTATVPAIPGQSSSFQVTAGSLPPGLSLNPVTGAITGSPSSSGSYTATITVTGANGQVQSYQQSFTIVTPASAGNSASTGGHGWMWQVAILVVLIALALFAWLFWWFLIARRRRRKEEQQAEAV